MLEKLKQYKITEKSKYELEVDKIIEDANRKLWNNNGYYMLYYLGAINQLKVIAEHLVKYDFVGRDEILMLLKSHKTIDEVPDDIKSLIDVILNEFDNKEENKC